MGYRIDYKPPEPERDLDATTTENRIIIRNGTTVKILLPCFYYIVDVPIEAEVHSQQRHDWQAFPLACQPSEFASDKKRHRLSKYYDKAAFRPIDLNYEGLTNAYAYIRPVVDGSPSISASVAFDEDSGSAYLLTLESSISSMTEALEYELNVVNQKGQGVLFSIVEVLPGPINSSISYTDQSL